LAFLGKYIPFHNLATQYGQNGAKFDPETGKEKDDKCDPKYDRWSIGLLVQV
jgi:hypothetical protein